MGKYVESEDYWDDGSPVEERGTHRSGWDQVLAKKRNGCARNNVVSSDEENRLYVG